MYKHGLSRTFQTNDTSTQPFPFRFFFCVIFIFPTRKLHSMHRRRQRAPRRLRLHRMQLVPTRLRRRQQRAPRLRLHRMQLVPTRLRRRQQRAPRLRQRVPTPRRMQRVPQLHEHLIHPSSANRRRSVRDTLVQHRNQPLTKIIETLLILHNSEGMPHPLQQSRHTRCLRIPPQHIVNFVPGDFTFVHAALPADDTLLHAAAAALLYTRPTQKSAQNPAHPIVASNDCRHK